MRVFNRCYRMVLLLAGVTVVATAAFSAAGSQAPASGSASPAQSPVERGKYFVLVQDCNGCHTPFKNGEPDMTRMLSGHPQDITITAAPKLPPGWAVSISDTNTAWSGPWGISFTTNLTPDRDTGIGGWTEDMFVKTIRNGKHLGGGRGLLPPMPWKMYGNLTDADLKAVYAYLKTIPAIRNKVPSPMLAGK